MQKVTESLGMMQTSLGIRGGNVWSFSSEPGAIPPIMFQRAKGDSPTDTNRESLNHEYTSFRHNTLFADRTPQRRNLSEDSGFDLGLAASRIFGIPMTGETSRPGNLIKRTADYEFKPHLVEVYRSANLKGSNLEEFVCTTQGVSSGKVLSPGAVFWASQMPRTQNADLEQLELAGSSKNPIVRWFHTKKLESNKNYKAHRYEESGKLKTNFHREALYGADMGRRQQFSENVHMKMLADMMGDKHEEAERLARTYKDEKLPKNLVLESRYKKYLGALASDSDHPFIRFSNPHDYIRVHLEDKTTRVVLWDAVFNLRNQSKGAGGLQGAFRNLMGNRARPKSEHKNRYMLAKDAVAFHGSQQHMVRICPRKSDVVPRIYTLSVFRFPNSDPVRDFIGKAVFQTFLYRDRPPNFISR